VVHHDERQVLLRAELQQRRPQERPGREVERPPRLLVHEPRGFGVVPRRTAQVDARQGERSRRLDALDRPATLAREDGAQRLVAAHHLAQRALQGLRVEPPVQPEGDRHVVDGARGLQLVEEPEPLLRPGEREVLMAWHRSDRRRLARRRPAEAPLQALLHHGSEPGWSGRLEQPDERQLDAQALAHPHQDLGGQQRVAAQVEEAVVAPHGGHAEDGRPDRHEDLLDRRPRRPAAGLGAGAPRSREGRAVELAVRGHRQLRQRHEDRGDHAVGERAAQELA
jgi:hypothetical protein